MTSRLTHEDVEAVRHTRGRSTLLFITDRCPVGCAHCSVDSRLDSPRITDWTLFSDIVDYLCDEPNLEVVGISGGEPFVERRGLSLVSTRLEEAGKSQVIYTSGVWAAGDEAPGWVAQILRRCSCVYLSTDAFHARGVADARYIRAARAIADAGSWIVVQVLAVDGMIERAESLLHEAFGPDLDSWVEIRPIQPLTHGRGNGVFDQAHPSIRGADFGPCPLVTAPMIRYDGRVTACCNESVIMNRGPARLRQQAASGAGVAAAMQEFHADPLLRVVGEVGLGALTVLPRFVDLGEERFTDQCQLCWRLLAREPERAGDDPLTTALKLVVGGNT